MSSPVLPPAIDVPESFRAMPRWWQDTRGRAWLDELPALVARQCASWSLTVDGPVLHGSNALVVPVRRDDEVCVLRLSPPGDRVDREAAALRWWDGRGTVRLLDADEERRTLLLERLDVTRTLHDAPLDEAMSVVAQLVSTLAVPAPVGAPTTAELAAEQQHAMGRDWLALGAPTSRDQLAVAQRLAGERAAAPVEDVCVDGDLHCRQVLAGQRAPWLVVDPVLLRGDREYDLARVLWERLDEFGSDAAVRAAFDRFVRETDVPEDRARSWVVLRSMSYLLWGLARGLTLDPPKCRRLLDLFA